MNGRDYNSYSGEPVTREQFVELRRANTLLSAADFDENDTFITDPACEGCRIPEKIAEFDADSDAKFYDMNERLCAGRMMVENVYRDCPGRAINHIPGWKRILQRALNTEPVNVWMIRRETKGKAPGTFTPCGLDIEQSPDQE
jgi:hypothetical protein